MEIFWPCVLLVIIICLVYVQLHLVYGRAKVCLNSTLLTNKIVVITGGSRGIGYEIALELARRQAIVIIGSRSEGDGFRAATRIRTVAGNQNVRHIPLDLGDIQSIQSFASDVLNSSSNINLLINNAAIAVNNNQRGYYHDPVFAVNYLGHFLLTHLLRERLVQSAPSRIINVSCLSHKFLVAPLNFMLQDPMSPENFLFPWLAGYGQSKLALVLHAKELSRRLSGTGVTANSVHPGFAITGTWDNVKVIWPRPFRWLLILFMRPLTISAYHAAQCVVHCAVAEELAGVSGKYFEKCVIAMESKLACDSDVGKKLWDVSELLVGCTPRGAVPLYADLYDEAKIVPSDTTIYWCSPEKKREGVEAVEKIVISRT